MLRPSLVSPEKREDIQYVQRGGATETREGWPLLTDKTRETREGWPLLTDETRETREGWSMKPERPERGVAPAD